MSSVVIQNMHLTTNSAKMIIVYNYNYKISIWKLRFKYCDYVLVYISNIMSTIFYIINNLVSKLLWSVDIDWPD